jgi:hypothetical protein
MKKLLVVLVLFGLTTQHLIGIGKLTLGFFCIKEKSVASDIAGVYFAVDGTRDIYKVKL